MVQGFLTNGGNLLVSLKDKFAFVNAEGYFLRECFIDEAEFLQNVATKVEITSNDWLKWDGQTPQWEFVVSIPVLQDYTNFKAETSSNGGDYAFYQYKDIFFAVVAGTPTFRSVERFSTSADFDYDEMVGGFQQNLSVQEFLNCERGYLTRSVSENIFLEQLSESIAIGDIFNTISKVIEGDEQKSFSIERGLFFIVDYLSRKGLSIEQDRRGGSLCIAHKFVNK